jgi:hypothetical protein
LTITLVVTDFYLSALVAARSQVRLRTGCAIDSHPNTPENKSRSMPRPATQARASWAAEPCFLTALGAQGGARFLQWVDGAYWIDPDGPGGAALIQMYAT